MSFLESFTYDSLNRLTSATLNTSVAPPKSFSYDSIGNMLTKSDVGTYSYPTAGSTLPHAVAAITGSVYNTSFTYDANGNQTAGLGRSITYTSFNKPASITQGSSTLFFSHDPDRQRFKQAAPEGVTLYVGGFGAMAEQFSGSSTSQWNDYLTVGNVLVSMHTVKSDETTSLRYFHTDHLGSVSVVTDETGSVVERLSYDAWGKRRFANGADDPAGSIASQTTHGFTGHEHLADVGLIHMNGRVYDPLVGRMMSADPTVPDAMNPQAWNRYSYVGNDPLAFTDPSGFSWLSSFFHKAVNFLQKTPIVGAILKVGLTIVLSAILTPVGASALEAALYGATASALSSAAVTGLSGGKLGDILKSAAIAGATVIAFNAIHALTDVAQASVGKDFAYGFNVASHAGAGCVISVASGGSCGSGAVAGAVSAAGAPVIAAQFGDNLLGGSLASGALGGLGSVAGGGKFETGFTTGAFGYLFNQMANGRGPNDRHELGRQAAMSDAQLNGYTLLNNGDETMVSLPGLPPRIYDFAVFDPASRQQIGVEVKTSWFDTIFLNKQQVTFDVAVANGELGPAQGTGLLITGVQYYTYCFQCYSGEGQLRSFVLQGMLDAAGIPTYPARRLSQ
jgi:RHS repeat-associated protein